MRVAACQRFTAADFSPGGGQVAALAVAELLVFLLHRLAVVGTGGALSLGDCPAVIFHLPFFLLAAILCSGRERVPAVATVVPLALLGAVIPLHTLYTLLLLMTANGWVRPPAFVSAGDCYFPFFGWWIVASSLIPFRLLGPGRRLTALLVFLLCLYLPLWYFPRGDLWVPREAGSPGDLDDRVTKEEIFYRQQDLLDERLAALKPGRTGVPDLYFIGMAGYGDENVFGHEVEVISRLFDERFATAGRSISLINNPRTLRRDPIASRTSLERTLKHLGQIMNHQEDTLFLYLTSHGSEEHELEVSLWPLELDPLDAGDLRKILDEAGIVWRVVVVSACYSGGFIPPLREEHTLVITASDAEHNSFGCGSESDFTYFGKAYFDEELRRTHSFIEAFAGAKGSINRREKAAKETPSNPQIFVGAKMKEHLEKLERRLREEAGKGKKK